MGELRIRIKFGEHEFEGEGPAESVERRAEAFQQMIAPPGPLPPPLPEKPNESKTETTEGEEPPSPTEQRAMQLEGRAVPQPVPLDQIVHVRGRILSVSVKTNVQKAVLVILLGQRHFHQNERVSGIEIMDGLRDSGIHILRVDTLLTKLGKMGSIIVMGEHRRRRYRLSTAGVTQAEQVACELSAQLSSSASV